MLNGLLGGIVAVLLITILLYYGAHPIYENIEIALKRVPVYLFGLLYGKWSYEEKTIAYKNIWIACIVAAAYFVIEKMVALSLIDRYDLSILAVLLAILLSDYLCKRSQKSQYRIMKRL